MGLGSLGYSGMSAGSVVNGGEGVVADTVLLLRDSVMGGVSGSGFMDEGIQQENGSKWERRGQNRLKYGNHLLYITLV